MRVAFAGTPEFARFALDAIVTAGFDVPFVFTQPDRPAGRGQKLSSSPVKQFALDHGIPVFQPERLKDLPDSALDVLVVAAYGLILPQTVLDIPRAGCLNIHASLLPRWRGAAPIQRAIEAGDAMTGITIMQMEAGLDTGPILMTEILDIAPTDTAATLHAKLAMLGGQLIVTALNQIGQNSPLPQPDVGVTYAHKIMKSEGVIDWRQSAIDIERKIRAFDPFPGCTAELQGIPLKIWKATALPALLSPDKPGTLLRITKEGGWVACGAGTLLITEVQRAGGKRTAYNLSHGYSFQPH